MKYLVCSDVHFPHQDKKAVKSFIELAAKVKPNYLVLLGDIADFYGLSRFSKDSSRVSGLQQELDMVSDFITMLRKASKNSKIVFMAGNHEARLQKYLYDSAPALSKLRSLELPTLLELDSHGAQFLPYGTPFTISDDCVATHGSAVRVRAGMSGFAESQKHGCSGISGHTHRLGLNWYRNYSRSTFWIENGCLCDTNPDYILGTPDWQQGCSLITAGKEVVPEVIPFDGRGMWFRGTFISA
jgi:predicted phosphodiesterase